MNEVTSRKDINFSERRGLNPTASAYIIGELAGQLPSRTLRRPPAATLVVCPSTQIAELVLEDLSFFLRPGVERGPSAKIASFLSWEVLPFDLLSPATSVSAARLDALYTLATGRSALVVATVEALMQRIVPKQYVLDASITLRAGAKIDRGELLTRLVHGGYARSSLVEECGQVAVRGSVVDFYPSGSLYPVRLELFGDSIESIRLFDPSSQRSVGACESIDVLPVREVFYSPGGLDDVVRRLKDRASNLEIAQRTIEPIEEALRSDTLWPGLEQLQPLLHPETASFWNFLPEDSLVVAYDLPGVLRASDDFAELVSERASRAIADGKLIPAPEQSFLSQAEFESNLMTRLTTHLAVGPLITGAVIPAVASGHAISESDVEPISGNEKLVSSLTASRHRAATEAGKLFEPLAKYVRAAINDGYSVAITVGQTQRLQRMHELLEGYELVAEEFSSSFIDWSARAETIPKTFSLIQGFLQRGVRITDRRLLVISDSEIFPDIVSRRQTAAAKQVRRFIGSLSQLKPGDFVVHMDYGIGMYHGLKQIAVEGRESEFVELEYAEQAKLFVPVEGLARIQKYSGADAKRPPALTRLGGKVWEKTKAKVKKTVAELAGQLLNTMATREISRGFSFGEFDIGDAQFADSFPFEETADQTQAISDVLGDMASEKPMDRLVCGDVGYGKTEVALRAAFKAANAGKQVAVLVPTTILADQHFQTFRARFDGTAATVGCVSRFYSAEANKATLANVELGKLDVVIGTHRLLQKDVVFKDLGLVIVDEEHRFGVGHKEKLKRLRADVDFLTLSATPIPRTLHMSLVGIRDLSLIETAPVNRQVTRTYLANYDADVVREAIQRELGRSGQVFYIHNRVQDIDLVAAEVREIVPNARVAFAHGQMRERELETIMHRFVNREIDVLISTTIVESGLDIPNANTIIIRKAEHFGLAELYQLRGRVGRSNRRAYAYLLISDPLRLGTDARRRLEVLQSLDDLGVGFRLAMQDMEIRGAGNLLGRDQSGHVNAVGYELYSKILKEAVEELRRRAQRATPAAKKVLSFDPEVSIGFPAFIPPVYVPDVGERLLLYQRLVELEDKEEAALLSEEITDRFGTYPDEVEVLIELMIFRSVLRRNGIATARLRSQTLYLSFHPDADLNAEALVKLVKQSRGALRLSPAMVLAMQLSNSQSFELESPQELTERVEELMAALD